MSYCTNCGEELKDNYNNCPKCGNTVGKDENKQNTTQKTTKQKENNKNQKFWFHITITLVASGLLLSLINISFSLLIYPISIITIYLDLNDLDGYLLKSSNGSWVLSLILFYLLAFLIYIIKRPSTENIYNVKNTMLKSYILKTTLIALLIIILSMIIGTFVLGLSS